MAKRILTVDDSVSVRMMVSFTLREAGYEVKEAANGMEAVGLLDDEAFDLLVVDLNMPQLDGLGLINRVRNSDGAHKFVPIIVLTTESQETKKNLARQAGATGWMVKPFRPEQLVGVVKKVIG